VTVQRRFRAEFQNAAPVFSSLKKWFAKFRDEAPRPGRITVALALVDRDMLIRLWNEMDYCIDACRITKGVWRYAPV